MNEFYEEQQNIVHETIRELHTRQTETETSEGTVDIGVSFDGTWLTRGHKSHIGAGFVIKIDTGFVMDFEILSNFCFSCDRNFFV